MIEQHSNAKQRKAGLRYCCPPPYAAPAGDCKTQADGAWQAREAKLRYATALHCAEKNQIVIHHGGC